MATRLQARFHCDDRPSVGPGIGLAMGGGFARAFAYLGVLSVLQDEQIPISCMTGSSVGAVISAAYAGGIPLGIIIATCRELRFRDLASWRFCRNSLASNKRLGSLLDRCFDSRQFEDLPIPVSIIATDLGTGDPVVFKQGLLADAVRASCAFPGLFEPVQIGTRYLADGTLVTLVPTRAARALGARIVVAVSIGVHDGERVAPSNMFQIVSRAIHAAQKNQSEPWERYADVVLYPSIQSIAWNDFDRIDEAIAAGAAATQNALPQIRGLLVSQVEIEAETLQQSSPLLAGALQ